MVFSAGRAAPALRQTGFYDPRHAVPGQSRLPCPPFFTLSAFVKFSERQREKGGVRQRHHLSGGVHSMAEELLNAQDKKYGIGHAVDPVFFDCGEAFSQLTDRSVKTRWDMRHIPACLCTAIC